MLVPCLYLSFFMCPVLHQIHDFVLLAVDCVNILVIVVVDYVNNKYQCYNYNNYANTNSDKLQESKSVSDDDLITFITSKVVNWGKGRFYIIIIIVVVSMPFIE